MKLKKIAKELVKDFGIKVKYANLERDDFDGFFAYYEDNFIVVPREEENYYCEDFMEDFKNRYPEVNAHEITISILHEVGHCMVHLTKSAKPKKPLKLTTITSLTKELQRLGRLNTLSPTRRKSQSLKKS